MTSPSPSIVSPAAYSVPQLCEALSSDERATVVTPNRRLAVHLKDRFDTSQRLAGKRAWATPDILPLATFLERIYCSLSLRGEESARPRLLDAAPSQLLWQTVVRTSDVSSHLLSLTQTADQAAAAWSVAHAWELWPAIRGMALNEDAEVFLGWAQRFQQLCRDRDVIDGAVLSTVVTAWLKQAIGQGVDRTEILPHQLFTAGFDIVTPQQQYFLAACGAIGLSVSTVRSADTGAQREAHLRRVEFATEAAELQGCAAWAHQRLQADPEQRIAIVVPDLRAKRGAVARALTDALQPGQRAMSMRAGAGASPGFELSLGLALNEYALVHDALSLIAFSQSRSMPFLAVSALLRSPFITGATSEIASRARLDAALREVLGPEIGIFTLQRKLKLANDGEVTRAARGCPILLSVIDRVGGVGGPPSKATSARKPAASKPSPREWSRHFSQVLLAWGFPGEETLDSPEYQVLEKFRDALATLALLETVQPRMHLDEALNHLRKIVADTVFQPDIGRNVTASIQVLGILESAGQSFDAVWVTGLYEEAWPLTARPNPFIPAALQRAAGVTEASAEASLALDQRITLGWRSSAPEVVFSHSKMAGNSGPGDEQRAASTLTRDVALVEMFTLIGESTQTDYARALYSLREREAVPDTPVATLPVPTKVRGGATVLRDQAACPFRAFARHRLGARTLATPEAGLNAAVRGTLLHRVMCLVWTRLQTHEQLMAMEAAAMEHLVMDVVSRAIVEASAMGVDSLTGRFADIERARLSRLVIEWLTYERERTPFEVVACEQTRDVAVSGLSMRLRLDRMDRLSDGTHALIDYKTGVAKVSDWLGARPDEPQLPLYLHTAEQIISVLAFARVKRGPRGKVFGFEGVSAAENLLPDVQPIEYKYGMEKKGYISWDVLLAEWEGSLNALAGNFIRGDALVDPKYGNLTCAQCDLQSVCRISEFNIAPLSDEDDARGGAGVSADALNG